MVLLNVCPVLVRFVVLQGRGVLGFGSLLIYDVRRSRLGPQLMLRARFPF